MVVISGPPVEGLLLQMMEIKGMWRRSCQSHPIVGRSGGKRLGAPAVGNHPTANAALGGWGYFRKWTLEFAPAGIIPSMAQENTVYTLSSVLFF